MRRIEDDEYFFISYDNIIKDPSTAIIFELVHNPKYIEYKKFLKLDNLSDKSIEELIDIHTYSTSKNILEYLSISEFDYDLTFTELYLSCMDIYKNAPLLRMGIALPIILNQAFTKKVYIYSKEYDERIDNDIKTIFGGYKKITYINGEFIDAVKSIDTKLTTFIVDDIDWVQELIDNDLIGYKNIILANYAYNYKLSDIIIDEEYGKEVILKIDNLSKLMKEKIFKLSLFTPNDNLTILGY